MEQGNKAALPRTSTDAADARHAAEWEWITQHRGHNVIREAERSLRCVSCASIMWTDDRDRADWLLGFTRRP